MASTDKTPETATTDATEAKGRGKQVSVSLSDADYAALQDIRFTQRHEKPGDVLRVALQEYVARHAG